jgi:2-methylisocitrate lyase-like PEP mutase family enzyme
MSTTSELRKLLAGDELLIAPGAYDALTARLIELAGFSLVYATGAGISNSQLALSDFGLATMSEVLEQVRRMTAVIRVPLIADIDTGYGNALNVHRTLKEFARAGAAAVQVEDQVIPKKCGHFDGKQLISLNEAALKIRAAVDAREDKDLVIIARTDAIAVEGLEGALQRACAYREAGADMIFVEAPRSREELAEIGRAIPGPKVVNMVEGGRTPIVSATDLKSMGYKIALYANLTLRTGVKAIQQSLRHLRDHGDTQAILDRLITMEERGRITQKEFLECLEQNFLEDQGKKS